MAGDARMEEMYGRCGALATLTPIELTRQMVERAFVVAYLTRKTPGDVAGALAESIAESVPDLATWKLMCADFTGYLQAVRG